MTIACRAGTDTDFQVEPVGEVAQHSAEILSTTTLRRPSPLQKKLSEVDADIVLPSIARALKINPDQIQQYDYNPRLPDGKLNVSGLRISLRSLGAKDETIEDLMSYLRATVEKLEGTRAFRMDREPISWRAFNSSLAKHTRWDTEDLKCKIAAPLAEFVAELVQEFNQKRELTLKLRALKFELKAKEGEEGGPHSGKSAHPFSKTILSAFEKAVHELSYPGNGLSEESIKGLQDLRSLMRQDVQMLEKVGGRALTIEESKAFHSLLAALKRHSQGREADTKGPSSGPPVAVEFQSVTEAPPANNPIAKPSVVVESQTKVEAPKAPETSVPLDLFGDPLPPLLRTKSFEPKSATNLDRPAVGQAELDFEQVAIVSKSDSPASLHVEAKTAEVARTSWLTRVKDRCGAAISEGVSVVLELAQSGRDTVGEYFADVFGSRRRDEERAILLERLDRYVPLNRAGRGDQLSSAVDHHNVIRQKLLSELETKLPKGMVVPRGEKLRPDKLCPEHLRDGVDVWVCEHPIDNPSLPIGRYTLRAEKDVPHGFVLERKDGSPVRELTLDTISKLKRLTYDRSEILTAISQLNPAHGWQLQLVVPKRESMLARTVLEELMGRRIISSIESEAPRSASSDDAETHVQFTIGIGDGARVRKIAQYISHPQVLGELLGRQGSSLQNWYPARDGLPLGAGIVARFYDSDPEYDSGHFLGIPLATISQNHLSDTESISREAKRAVLDKGKRYGAFFFSALIGDENCREATILEGVREARAHIISLVPKDEVHPNPAAGTA